jgi:hypothetical protein
VTALNHHFNDLLLFFKEPTMAFILLLLWIGASIVIGKLAQASGRSFFIWFVISMLIDPIFGDSFCCSREVKMNQKELRGFLKPILALVFYSCYLFV